MDDMGDMDHMKMNMTGNDTSMDMPMKMYFHTGFEDTVLVKEWSAQTNAAVFGWSACFFVLALIYELLKYYRQLHLVRAQVRIVTLCEDTAIQSSSTATQESQTSGDKYERPLHRRSHEHKSLKMFSVVHITQTALHIVQVFLSYILMLAFMLFNVWFCLAVLLGAGVGYFLVGFRKQTSYSALDEDHCH